MADRDAVLHTLAGTLDGTPGVRGAAEARLAQLESVSGYFAILLQIITMESVHVDVRQAAILRLKNIVKQYWTIREGEVQRIFELDRGVIKENLLEAIIWQQVPAIRLQLMDCMYFVAMADFPQLWRPLLPAILKNFEAQDPNRVYGATCALSVLYRKYQFKKDRNELVESTLPVLLQLYQAVIQQTSPRAYELMRSITKMFFLATNLNIPRYLQQEPILRAWITEFLKTMSLQIPPVFTQGLSKEEMAQLPFWKAKKWIANLFDRLFNRFGRPRMVNAANKPFAEMYFANFVPVTLRCFMGILEQRKNREFISPRVLQQAYNFIDSCVSFAVLYTQHLQPARHFILLECVFPTLCLEEDDIKLWHSDPHDYVRKCADLMEEFHDPRLSATNVLIKMVKVRTRDCLDMVISAVVQIFDAYLRAPPGEKNLIHKEAAMRMIGSLRALLIKEKRYHSALENLLVKHVLPEFQNPVGFLRSRAAWCVGQFHQLPLSTEHKVAAVQLVMTAMQDRELPVKMEASKAMSRLVRDEEVAKHVTPMVPMLLDQFFRLINELGNEEIVCTLEVLIKHIGNGIAPFATKVSQGLVGFFLRLSQADEEDEEAALTALQCIRAINTILVAVSALPDLYAELEQIVTPLLTYLMTDRGMEFFEETLEMIVSFTYYPPQITPFMWKQLEGIVQAYHTWAVDYIRDMLPAIDNFISRGTDVFCGCKNPNYLELVLSMVTKVYTDDNLKSEAKHTNKIMETILAHCRGKVDHILPAIIELVSKKLFVEKDPQFRFLICDVLGGAAYYNPGLFLSIVAAAGPPFERTLFDRWLAQLKEMEAEKHQKMSALGLSSLCLVDLSATPLLRSAFPQVLSHILGLLKALLEAPDEGDDDDDDDDEDADARILDIDANQDNEEEMAHAEEYTKAIQQSLASVLEGDVDPENYESPLDDVDPFVFFAQCFQQLSQHSGALSHAWTSSLDQQAATTLSEVMTEATERKKKQDEKKDDNAGVVIHH